MSKSIKIFSVTMAMLLLFVFTTSANLASPGPAAQLALEKRLSARIGRLPAPVTKNGLPIPSQSGGGIDQLPGIAATADSALPVFTEPLRVKGIYFTSWMTGSNQFLQKMIAFISDTEINSVVIDVKDDTGLLSYPSGIALAREVGSDIRKYDPVKVLTLLKLNQIYTIARIVVFKDPLLARKRPDLAVQSSQGGLWRDKLGLYWVDPHNRKVWEYNVGVAKEAAQLGFNEVQFDYVRFTSDGAIQYCRYPGADGRAKADVIADFLKYAYRELHPLGVKVSADLFGLTCSCRDDMGIGQVLEKVMPNVDIVCPMVYPSHYPVGSYNIADPDAAPYETIFQGLSDAKKRVDAFQTEHPVIIRPWLQDFSLRHSYQREQILAQIKAVKDAGFQEYLFWNPSNKYDERKYRSRAESLQEEPVAPSPTPTPLETPFLNTDTNPVNPVNPVKRLP